METLWQWVISLPLVFVEFFSWITSPLEYFGVSPLMVFSFGGLTILIGILLIRLFVGG